MRASRVDFIDNLYIICYQFKNIFKKISQTLIFIASFLSNYRHKFIEIVIYKLEN